MRMGSRVPTRYVLVPGPVIIPGLRPSTRPTMSLGVARLGKSGSIQLMPPPSSCHPQVATFDVLVRLQGGGRALPDDLPLVHDVDAIGDPQGQVKVLLDEQDGEPLALEPAHDAPDLPHDGGSQPFRPLASPPQT